MAAANSKMTQNRDLDLDLDLDLPHLKGREFKPWLISLLIVPIVAVVHARFQYDEIVKACEVQDLLRNSSVQSSFSLMNMYYWFLQWTGFQDRTSNHSKETSSSLCSETWFYILFIIFTQKLPEDTCNLLSYAVKAFINKCYYLSVDSRTMFEQIAITSPISVSTSAVMFALISIITAFIMVILWRMILFQRNHSKICTNIKDCLHDCGHYNDNMQYTCWSCKNDRSLCLTPVTSYSRHEQKVINGLTPQRHHSDYSYLMHWIVVLIITALLLSIPWEFLRLYQKAVASRAANVMKGLPPHCTQVSMGWLENIQFLLRWHFSWSHNHDVCEDYYYSSLVDPLLEVNPLMVLSSVFTQGMLQPLEIASSSLGRSVCAFFAEIPTQWQPLIMLFAIVMAMVLLLMSCRYRLLIPLLLRIEPKTPVMSPFESDRRGNRRKVINENGDCPDYKALFNCYRYVKNINSSRKGRDSMYQRMLSSRKLSSFSTYSACDPLDSKGPVSELASPRRASFINGNSSRSTCQYQNDVSDKEIKICQDVGDIDFEVKSKKTSDRPLKKNRVSRKK